MKLSQEGHGKKECVVCQCNIDTCNIDHHQTHVYTQAICEYTCVEPLWVGNKFCHVGWTLLLFGVWCKWHVLLDMWLEVAEEMPQIPQMKISTKPQGL